MNKDFYIQPATWVTLLFQVSDPTNVHCLLSSYAIVVAVSQAQLLNDELKIETNFGSGAQQYNPTSNFTLTIQGSSSSPSISPTTQKIDVHLGCYDYLLTKVSLLSSLPEFVTKTSENEFKIHLYKSEDIVKFEINKILKWETNAAPCGPFKVSLCFDQLCQVMLHGSISFESNPSLLDETVYTPVPLLNVNAREATDTMVYIQGMSYTNQTLEAKAHIKVCGDEQITTLQADITLDLIRAPVPPMEFDLTQFFNCSDPLCPILMYNLTKTKSANDPYQSSDAVIVGTML